MEIAKELFVEPYGIEESRLISVESLMEILYKYVITEYKDIISLLKSKNAPDSSWDEKVWKCCRSLLKDIECTLEDDDKNVNNENMLAIIQNWSSFNKLRAVLNEFVKTEKTNAYNDLMKTIYRDIKLCVEDRKNDITLLQKGTEEMQGQIQALEEAQLEMNQTLGSIRRNFRSEEHTY